MFAQPELADEKNYYKGKVAGHGKPKKEEKNWSAGLAVYDTIVERARDLRDAVELQGEVTQSIATAIRTKVTPEERARLGRNHRVILCSSDLLNETRRSEIVAEIKDPVGYMTPEEQKACSRDVQRHCRAVIDQGDLGVLACLQQNRPKISQACDQVLKSHGQ